MKEKFMGILADLLDDHNVILYILFILAIVYPDNAKEIVGGILGFWTRGMIEKVVK